MNHFVYILKCADGTLYTGYTTDVTKRVARHNAGRGAKYTRGRRPCKLAFARRFDSQGVAMTWERGIKSWSRKLKLVLCEAWTNRPWWERKDWEKGLIEL